MKHGKYMHYMEYIAESLKPDIKCSKYVDCTMFNTVGWVIFVLKFNMLRLIRRLQKVKLNNVNNITNFFHFFRL